MTALLFLLLAGAGLAAAAQSGSQQTRSGLHDVSDPPKADDSGEVHRTDVGFVSVTIDAFDKALNAGLECVTPSTFDHGNLLDYASALSPEKDTIARLYSDGLCYAGFVGTGAKECADQHTLTAECLDGYIQFTQAANMKLLLGLNMAVGRNLTATPPILSWNSTQSVGLLRWLAGGGTARRVYALEVGNECNCYGGKGNNAAAQIWRDHGPETMAAETRFVRRLID